MLDLNDAEPARPAERFDLDEIVARLRATAEHWVPRHFPNGRRVGDEWRLANIRGDAPRKNGSCVIALTGEHAGDWIDFDGGEGGGPINTLEHAIHRTGRELISYAADLTRAGPQPKRGATKPSSKQADRAREIDHILSKAVPLAGTLGERYLTSRRLPVPDCTDLLFHPDLTHWESRCGFPGRLRWCGTAAAIASRFTAPISPTTAVPRRRSITRAKCWPRLPAAPCVLQISPTITSLDSPRASRRRSQ